MSNNLVTGAKSSDWNATQFLKGEQTHRSERFFCVCKLPVPACYGRVLGYGAVFGRASSPFTGCGIFRTLNPATLISKIPLRQGGSKIKRSLTMAQLRLLVDDRLSVYAKRVRNAIKQLPVFGGSPRILLDEQEISQLSKISVDKVRVAIKELQREGYLAPFYHGRKSKCSVYALQNPALSGDVMEVWA